MVMVSLRLSAELCRALRREDLNGKIVVYLEPPESARLKLSTSVGLLEDFAATPPGRMKIRGITYITYIEVREGVLPE